MTEAARLLRYARRRAGLSQRALAAKAGVAPSCVSRIESSRADPRVSTLSRLLRACETTLEALPGSGAGIDRTAFTLHLTPAERLAPRPYPPTALRLLVERGVRFVLIGDNAAYLHGSPARSDVVDVCPDPGPENLARLAEVQRAERLGAFLTPYGTSGYADLAARAEPVDLGGLTVPVACRDDVLRMKRAYDRPKDRIEVEAILAAAS
jgi:transcriptional regulator with XRE-family HTH domain